MWETYARTSISLIFLYLTNEHISATAVILSIAGSAPFNGTSDQTLAVAYISVFILIFTVS